METRFRAKKEEREMEETARKGRRPGDVFRQLCTARSARRRCGDCGRRRGVFKRSMGLACAVSALLFMTTLLARSGAVVFSKKEIWQDNPVAHEANKINIVLTSSMRVSAGMYVARKTRL